MGNKFYNFCWVLLRPAYDLLYPRKVTGLENLPAEGGFVLLFSDTVPAGTVGIVAVCWRLIAEYIPFLIGLYYTLTVFGRDFLNRQLR